MPTKTINPLPANLTGLHPNYDAEIAVRAERAKELIAIPLDDATAGDVAELKRMNDEIERLHEERPLQHPGHHAQRGGRYSRHGGGRKEFGRVDGIGEAFLKGLGAGGRDGLKALDGTSGASLVPAFFDPRIRDLPQRNLFVRSLIPTVRATGDKVWYLRQTVATQNAAAVAASALKPTSVYTVERVETPVTTVAHVTEALDRDLGVLSAIFETAVREEVVESNPARRAERPKVPRRRWRILAPEEVARVDRAFLELASDADDTDRPVIEQCRVVFLTLIITGLRRHEACALRWRDVDLIDNVLRIDRSKSEAGERSIAIPPKLAELWQARRRSPYRGDDERVFAHPRRGGALNPERFAETFREALTRAKIDGYVRPFHDLRHGSLTLGAASGEGSVALMTRAGHANMATTKRYLHLAGTVFRDEAARLEERLLAGSNCYPTELTSADLGEPDPARQA